MTDKFLSTPSARRATTCCRCGAACGAYFYPRPPRGGRRSAAGLEGQAGRFLSTPSARRATLYNHRHAHCCQISIHALREEGDRATTSPRSNHGISIHALREEGDVKASVHLQTAYISIHALREEGDPPRSCISPPSR